jgi:hypothetical protein
MPSVLSLGFRQWNPHSKEVWGVTAAVASALSQLDLARPGSLPDLRSGPTLLLASDYGGQHKSATHEAFSFLLADHMYSWFWNEMRTEVRKRFLRDNRRMCYKGMNDRRKVSALLPFLDAANAVAGALVTVLVEKEFASGLRLGEGERDSLPGTVRPWPVPLLRRFIWITHLASALVAGLSAKGQNLIWITDEDDIAANDRRIIEATPLVAGILSDYLAHDLGHMRFGTTKCDSGDLFVEDFAAIPDLAAGALVEIPKAGVVHRGYGLRTPLRGRVPPKALNILSWLGARQISALRKVSLVVTKGDSSKQVRVRALDLETM